jgi:hypothetical protein
MVRSGTERADIAKARTPAPSEEKKTITMQYYVNGIFTDTPPKSKYNTDTASQTISDHESQESTGRHPYIHLVSMISDPDLRGYPEFKFRR